MGFREMRGGDGVSDVEIRRNEIIELLYTLSSKSGKGNNSFHEMICLTHRKKFYKKQDSSRRNFPVHRRWNYLTSLSLKSL